MQSKFLPFLVAILVLALFLALAQGRGVAFSMACDWATVTMVLVAYREMDWFSGLPRNFLLELQWVEWDRAILYHGGLQRAIESLGSLGPIYLDLCYALVYAVPPFFVAIFYIEHRRERVNGRYFCICSER